MIFRGVEWATLKPWIIGIALILAGGGGAEPSNAVYPLAAAGEGGNGGGTHISRPPDAKETLPVTSREDLAFIADSITGGRARRPSLSRDAKHANVTSRHLSYPDLVSRLYDLRYLAEPPEPGERSGNWTSHSRTPRYDAATDTYQNWGENSDGDGFLRKEGKNIVVAEMKGPGVIWRVWSAYPGKGHIKYFIDGSPTPVLDMPFVDYFNNQKGPFNYPELTRVLSRGYNNYVPISFQKSIKIVLEDGWGFFYHFTYTTLPAGTSIPSFKGSFSDEDRAALAEANGILGRRGAPAKAGNDSEIVGKDIDLPPGKMVQIADLRGPRAITSINVAPLDFGKAADNSDRAQDIQILRQIGIQIAWDNEGTPSVWTPLGDFFGTAPGVNEYRSLPMGMMAGNFYSAWYMPFSRRAVLTLRNDGPEARRLRIEFTHRPEQRAAQMLRFHAKWHRDDFGKRDPARYLTGDRWPDWPVLMAEGGPGRFLGFHLHIWNPNPVGSKRKAIPGGWGNLSQEKTAMLDLLAKYRAWWGEGNEKFFVDGEKFPSTYGTGSEDYFGYAFAAFNPELFDSAFQSQPLNHNNYGHVSNVRFQVADNVPFQHSFEAVIEKYHPNEWPLLYAATAYWYQAPGVEDGYHPVPVKQRLNYFVNVEGEADIHEAEQLDIVRKDSGTVGFDVWFLRYSADHAIIWKDVAKAGDRLVFKVSAKESGDFEILLMAGRSPEAGVYQATLDGRVIGAAFDLGSGQSLKDAQSTSGKMFYEKAQYAVQLEEISLGRQYLKKGDHEIGVEALKPGRNGASALSLDYIRLRKVH